MEDFKSLTVIIVEDYCKVNPAWFKCLKMINSWKFRKKKEIWILKSNQKVIQISYITLIKYLKVRLLFTF